MGRSHEDTRPGVVGPSRPSARELLHHGLAIRLLNFTLVLLSKRFVNKPVYIHVATH